MQHSERDKTVTQELLHSLFIYDTETGNLIWKNDTGTAKKGSVAGYIKNTGRRYSRGYRYIRVNSKDYASHRLVWLFHNGSFPSKCIDHINTIRDDNRIENLRDVSHAENMLNLALGSGASSGYKGVYRAKGSKKWFSVLYWDGIRIGLGSYDDPVDAASVYHTAREFLGLIPSNVYTT